MKKQNKKNTRKTAVSHCCQATFATRSNGLWEYHVCDQCHSKTEPIKVWNKDLKKGVPRVV